MKNTNLRKIVLALALCLISIPIIAIIFYEFSTWRMHDYASDYNERQKCLEVPEYAEISDFCQENFE
jgi:hypothetical protein